MTVVLAVTMVQAASPAGAVPRVAAQAVAKAAPVVSRPDLVSAALAARSQGARVEALSERTDSAATWVNPDGSWSVESFAGPVRFKDPAGTDGWRDIDLSLTQAADGSVSVKSHPMGLKLSG